MVDEIKGNKKILVIEEIEDDTSIRKALGDKLTHEGFKILEAKDGEEGLTVALREHPDLILLDIMLPKMDGITVLDKLRHDPWGTSVPVLVLTNLSDVEDSLIRSHEGPLDYIVKANLKIEDLVKKVKDELGVI